MKLAALVTSRPMITSAIRSQTDGVWNALGPAEPTPLEVIEQVPYQLLTTRTRALTTNSLRSRGFER